MDDTELHDPHLWLEEVEGADALDWVRARNAEAEAHLMADPRFAELRSSVLEILEAEDRIDRPTVHGDRVHNFWTDADHPRGLLRRTSWDDWSGGSPTWETILDVDALGAAEGESWVFHGSSTRTPDRRRALIALSPGGSDASVTREFDLVHLRFVPEEEGGFVRPLGKGSCTWTDDDTVYVMAEVGPDSMTRSGYPRQVRRWTRGEPLEAAEVVFEGDVDDISVFAAVDTYPGHPNHVFRRALDFYTAEYHLLVDGHPRRIEVPTHVDVGLHGPWTTFDNRKHWELGDTTHPPGCLLVAPTAEVMAGHIEPIAVFIPTPERALAGITWTRTRLVLTVMEDVRTRAEVATPPPAGDWSLAPLDGAPDVWTLGVGAVDGDELDDLWISGNDLVTPETLARQRLGEPAEVLRRAPLRFDAGDLTVTQHFARSDDGTRVPYFEVSSAGGDGPRPTLLGGYGGFEVPRLPNHAPVLGRAWLSAGHTYVLANIRGGGEYGPSWHQAGLREHRHRVYEDFEAVARDLIDRGVTTPSQLGCSGGSNGGLLVGNMYVRSPELWGAIVCQVPLLDMRRYHLLLAGASWMAEYGDPDDPDDWAFLRRWSPYQLVDPAVEHPPILLTTSTRDDRVHPGHARKMAALLTDLGKDVTYWENTEGGHGGAADAGQAATMQALVYTYLHQRLVDGPAG
ncbi:MAG: prolyl oligopeptidase family serine peptidase [Actinomycetota bacterium]